MWENKIIFRNNIWSKLFWSVLRLVSEHKNFHLKLVYEIKYIFKNISFYVYYYFLNRVSRKFLKNVSRAVSAI